jgi:hypothetical protein
MYTTGCIGVYIQFNQLHMKGKEGSFQQSIILLDYSINKGNSALRK